MKLVRVGSRESSLAVIQSRIVLEAIRAYDPEIKTELVTMKTRGDRILDRNLDKVGGKGLFIKELEVALAENRVDLTVHSLKDMTMDVSDELPLLAVSEREDPRDAFILPDGDPLSEGLREHPEHEALDYLRKNLDFSRPIGCSSNRRILQLSEIFPRAHFEPIRGNVQTRLAKLDSGRYCATVLAAAGLKRSGLEHRISMIFDPDVMLPAAGQGILAVQGRKGYDISFLDDFSDANAWKAALCERSFVRTLEGGCSSPVAAYAEVFDMGAPAVPEDEAPAVPLDEAPAVPGSEVLEADDTPGVMISLTGLNVDRNGRPFRQTITGWCSSDAECEDLGIRLAGIMKI